MKNFKKMFALITVVGILGAASASYAAVTKTPAEIAGETYGTVAKEAWDPDEFKAQMLERKKAILDQRVKDGTLSQAQADEIYNAIKNNQAACDGTGNAGIGRKYGAGFGPGCGMSNGQGMGRGAGIGACIGGRRK